MRRVTLIQSYTHPKRPKLQQILMLLIVFVSLYASQTAAENTTGITDSEIRIGQSCALTGPAMAMGKGMHDGAQTYFAHINSMGGIHGKKIRLITLDDGYKPEVCKKNTKALIENKNVFLLFGYVGTPTTKAVLPLVQTSKIPFFAPATGATLLRTPMIPNVFNIRASYAQETAFMVQRLISDKGITKIAVFYQNDAFGIDGLNGVQKAASENGISVIADASYERTAPVVDTAVSQLMKASPEAVILVGSAEPCAALISGMRDAGSKALFLTVSFVGGDALASQLSNKGLGVVVTQVTPFPFYRHPVLVEYNLLTLELTPDSPPTSSGTEGFIAAKALCKILMETPAPLTREAFMATAETQLDADIGGFSFSFSPERHQGSDRVYMTQLGPGGFLTPINHLGQLYRHYAQ
ncbi:MAG: hypothetical protein CSA22_10660 [Deltaproteobacteria bacterium]|nr:MAG: hypothetical protein CSA22_10660 [Deltaproteobacteria bacterium]